MVTEKVKAELKRFLSPKQADELSKQLDGYEKKVREAVKQFDVKGREAKAIGQEKLDKFAAQIKRTGLQLEKQLKAFVNDELIAYFKSLKKTDAPAAKTSKKKSTKGSVKKRASVRTSAAHAH